MTSGDSPLVNHEATAAAAREAVNRARSVRAAQPAQAAAWMVHFPADAQAHRPGEGVPPLV
jgi:hypothetical protein